MTNESRCPICGQYDAIMIIPKRMYDVRVGLIACCRCKTVSWPGRPFNMLKAWQNGDVHRLSNNQWNKLIQEQSLLDQCLILKRTELAHRHDKEANQ